MDHLSRRSDPQRHRRPRASVSGQLPDDPRHLHQPLPLSGNPYDPKCPRPTYDEKEIIGEIRSFFATGVNLQELYVIPPDLMSAATWDVLAEAARWSRATPVCWSTRTYRRRPGPGEVYGWASWTPCKAIMALRNPDDRGAQFALDIQRVFELPAGTARHYRLHSPWAEDAAKAAIEIRAGQPRTIALRPFETLVLDATPVSELARPEYS